jgi:prolyl-tRNA synthetase
MLWSKLFIPTLRDDSQPLLVRAAYMRGSAYLYLGQRVMRKMQSIVREEMIAMGGQEFGASANLLHLARELRTYRQLPQIWYRAEESYSFDLTAEGREESYRKHEGAYRRVFDRFGVKGAANDEESTEEIADPPGDLAPEEFHTPGQKTIADIAAFTGLPETSQMKSLVMVAGSEPVLALLRGDHQLSETKCAAVLGASDIRPARAEEIRELFGADAGSLGPVGIAQVGINKVRIIADEALRGRRNMIAGANKNDYHLRHVTPGEDFKAEFLDLRNKGCSEMARLLRVSAHLPDLHVTSEGGRDVRPAVGRYSMHLERILEAAAEQHRAQDGFVLPSSIAPFSVVVTPVHPTQLDAAHKIYEELLAAGADALLDDRDLRPGVKFKDADLIGVPYRINVGRKMAEGLVEMVERKSRQLTEVPVERIVQRWTTAIRSTAAPS